MKLSRWLEAMPRKRNSRRPKEKRRLELTTPIEISVSLKESSEKLAHQWWKLITPPPRKRRRPARDRGLRQQEMPDQRLSRQQNPIKGIP